MAQYEQKTDSREFEVANPDQSMGGWGGNSPAEAADIAIRLWGPARSDRRGPLTWKTESVLVYMIADLVSASRGRIAEDSATVLAAHFDSCRQAVVAAKRVQTAILEFLTCRPGERTGGAILIYQPRTADATGPSGDAVQLELGQAKPGQILLAENVSRRLRDVPGMEFLSPPAGGSGHGPTGLPEAGLTQAGLTQAGLTQAGLTELVWTTPERVALMRESVGDGAEPMGPDAPPVGATLIVDSPFARRGLTNEAAPPTVRTRDYIVRDRPETASRPVTGLTQKASSSLTEELELDERPLFTRTRVIFGVVGVVLVAALIAVLFFPTRVAKPQIPPTPPQQDQTAGTATGSTGTNDQKTPPTVEPPAKLGQPEPETTKPAAKLPVTVTKPPADTRAKNKKETQDTSEPPPVVEESGSLSKGDIPGLLRMALKDTGDGEYEKARREYKKVLSLEPKNQQAIDGIIKLDKIQRDQQ
jgi:hypothetical protein